jgi:Zn finger protein HypA/HybF involved in hydrogenase expression
MRSPKNRREALDEIIRSSISIAEVLRKLGLKPSGGNHTTITRLIRYYSLNVSHFRGQAHMRGKKVSCPQRRWSISEAFIENSPVSTGQLRRMILRDGLLEYRCANCGIAQWLGQPLTLQLDHINGIGNDARIENLRFLCPNCHSQTDTWGAKQGRPRTVPLPPGPNCPDCWNSVSHQGCRCRKCAGRASQQTKIHWPVTPVLKRMVEETSYLAVARQLGVSDNAIRKRLRNHPETP